MSFRLQALSTAILLVPRASMVFSCHFGEKKNSIVGWGGEGIV